MRDAVVLNAGAALAVYDAPDADVEAALAAGVAKAAEAIDSGAAGGGAGALGGGDVGLTLAQSSSTYASPSRRKPRRS